MTFATVLLCFSTFQLFDLIPGVYVCTVHVYVHVHVQVDIDVDADAGVDVDVYVSVHICVNAHVSMYLHVNVYMHVYVYVMLRTTKQNVENPCLGTPTYSLRTLGIVCRSMVQ